MVSFYVRDVAYRRFLPIDVDEATTVAQFFDALGEKIGWGNSRHTCSIRCRCTPDSPTDDSRNLWYANDHDLVRSIVPFERLKGSLLTCYPRMGSCKPFCRRLIRTSECSDSSFTRHDRLGFGSSGEVFAVTHSPTGKKKLALKVVRCRNQTERADILQKYEVLVGLPDDDSNSRFLVPFFSAFEVGRTDVGVLMPLYRGTLLDKIEEYSSSGTLFSATEIHSVAYNVLQGLAALSSISLVHRDVKSSNIFLAPSHKDGVDFYLLGDMEASRIMRAGRSHITGGTGTYAHLAPEQLTSFESSPKTDIWGIGCVLHWLIIGGRYPKLMHVALHRQGTEDFVRSISVEMRRSAFGRQYRQMADLVVSMLSPNASSRPSAEDCMSTVDNSASKHGLRIHTCTCMLPSRCNFVTSSPLMEEVS
mmetsp:Transcript_21739/g.47406  ORF Transcript_21739/g.47406 Transcript_21739/m.47406 type:complete len:419 (+) Transcript_21739:103-1359(+)